MRGCGRIERPAFPAPSDFQTRKSTGKTRAHARRDRGGVAVRQLTRESAVVMAGRSDEAIHLRSCDAEPWIASLRPQRRHENPQITPPPASAALWPTRGSDKKDRARCNDDVTTKSFGCLKSKIR